MRMYSVLTIMAMLSASIAQAAYVQTPYPISAGGTGVASQTPNIAVTTDGSGKVVSTSSTTASEIGFVHGVTSAIQTQFTGKANTALSNIASTALSADLVCATSGSCKLGSAAVPFGDSFLNLAKDGSSVISADFLNRLLKNSSGNSVEDFSGTVLKSFFPLQLQGSSSGDIQISAGATPTAHTVTLPATVCALGQYWADNGSGVYSCTSPSNPNLTVVDGGNAAYAIQAGDGHIRDTTTLTGDQTYTLPACTAGNIGERHEVKNLPAQTHNIILAAATGPGDNIDGVASVTVGPGDSVPVICSAFSASGTWDIE